MSYQLTAMSLIALAITNCSGGKMDTTNKVTFPTIKEVPAEAWQKLAQKKIYFGHQSVGYNIMDGVRDIMNKYPQTKLNVVETLKPEDFKNPLFAHSPIGQNFDLNAKSSDFMALMDKGVGNAVDVSFFKYCFVDITNETNVEKLFDEYKTRMSMVKDKYPKVIFVHITVPLTTKQHGLKGFIKKIMGRPIGGYEDNINRHLFNERIRKEYAGKEPVFDLAAIEATYPDGSAAIFESNGKTYPRFVSEYTDDGGHLNEHGRKKDAEQLLILLANLANK